MRFAPVLVPFCCWELLATDATLANSPTVIIGSNGIEVTTRDWPWWRGPLRNVTASPINFHRLSGVKHRTFSGRRRSPAAGTALPRSLVNSFS